MAEHVLNTQIKLRYDTLRNWERSTLILAQGEVAIAVASYSSTITPSDTSPAHTPPAIGLKVGDGGSTFSELPWVQAVAADIYDWAKQPLKPTYSASEITDLQSFVEMYAGAGGSGPVTGATRIYQLVRGTGANINKYYLQYRTEDSDWVLDTSSYIDLSEYAKVYSWIGTDLNKYFTLDDKVNDTVEGIFETKKYPDAEDDNKVVTAVSQTNGIISVTKRALNLDEINGVLGISQGGTGLRSIDTNEILVGTSAGEFSKRTIDNILESNNHLATNAAIINYIAEQTAGLTGAMHFVGEATVAIDLPADDQKNPFINNYDFSQAQKGDVILANDTQELVWTGTRWRLLGDEGSYAIKGSITDEDVSNNANIAQNKIYHLQEDLTSINDELLLKVDKIEGMGLSTNDFTTALKNKLLYIEDQAQVNKIDYIYLNDIPQEPKTYGSASKVVNLQFNILTDKQVEKLDEIEDHAEVNNIKNIFVNDEWVEPETFKNKEKSVRINYVLTEEEKTLLSTVKTNAEPNTVETIIINGNSFTPNASKEVIISLNQSILNLDVLAGARVPGKTTEYEAVEVTTGVKLLELARIAKTGKIDDILQDEYIIIDCGTSTEDLHPTSSQT